MSQHHGNMKATDEELLKAIESVDEPVASAREVADSVGMTRTAVTERLKELRDDGDVAKKSVGRGFVWWTRD